MLPPQWFEVLLALVQRKANVLISGGTGTGKTTLLAAMLSVADSSERLITVEEARELAPQSEHHVALVSRRPNVEGAGEITLSDLVRAALRMRPDRLVLGECRGAEVREVLQALNTGHDGGMATLHANSASAVPARLEALGALAGMKRDAVAAQTIGAIDVVLHLRRREGKRYLSEIGVPERVGGELRVQVVASWDGTDSPPQLSDGASEFFEKWRQ
jgi:pilus assembly protein CpaF